MRAAFRRLLGAIILAVVPLAGPAAAQPGGGLAEPPPCTAVAVPGVGESVACSCDIAEADLGAVWGTGIFTDDSAVCTAAVHAGLLTRLAAESAVRWSGIVRLDGAPGCETYFGSTANGVTTFSYGPWPASFFFPAAGTGSCTPEGAPPGLAACPITMLGTATETACFCDAGRTRSGAVWGTRIYTADSDICRAAVHAGHITLTGGAVLVVPVPAPAAYAGTQANGVTTFPYGPYEPAFGFKPYPPAP